MAEKQVGFVIAGAAALIPQELALAKTLIEGLNPQWGGPVVPQILAGTSSGSLSATILNGVLQWKAGKGTFDWKTMEDVIFSLKNKDIYKNSVLLDPAVMQEVGYIGDVFFQIAPVISDVVNIILTWTGSENVLEKIMDTIKDSGKLLSDVSTEFKDIQKSFQNLGELEGHVLDIITTIAGIWKNGYILDTSPLKDTLTKYFKGKDYLGYDRLGDMYLHTFISAVNDINGQTKRFNSQDPVDAQQDIVNVLMASTAIPVIFPNHTVGTTPYIDGGTGTDNIPVEDLVSCGKFDEIYVIAPKNSALLEGFQHIMPQMPLLSNGLFAINVSHTAITPYQLARTLALLKKNGKAYFYMPAIEKDYNPLNFDLMQPQYEETLAWAQKNRPVGVAEFLKSINFPVNQS